MKPLNLRLFPVLLFCLPVLLFISCQKEPEEKDLPPTFSNYLKKENMYFKLDAATAIYDSVAPDQTSFSLGFHNAEVDQSFVVFDYLMLPKTAELFAGTYTYQKLSSGVDRQAGRFHDLVLKCGSPVMSGLVYPVSGAKLDVKKAGQNYTVSGEWVMSGKAYQVRFAGPIEHMKAW